MTMSSNRIRRMFTVLRTREEPERFRGK